MAKISIIVPIYNVEQYVKKTIESVLSQTEPDLEIILVDDGSTDSSGFICDMYAQSDSRILVIHKENGGLSSARNAGVKRASSEYVLFLDGDDYLRADAAERLLQVALQYPSDIIQFRYQEVKPDETPSRAIQSGPIYQAHTPRELFENLYRLGGVAASAATKLMRRDLVQEIPFESIRHEDEMWCTQAFQRNLTATYISDELYYYVIRENSIIHSSFNLSKLDIFKVIDTRLNMLNQLRLDDFLPMEYCKLFLSILFLHSEATESGNQKGLCQIQSVFRRFKNEIISYAELPLKFRIILWLMWVYYPSIKLYDYYLGKNR